MVTTLAVLIPTVFVIALLSRPTPAVVAEIPAALLTRPAALQTVLYEREATSGGITFAVTVLVDTGASRSQVTLAAHDALPHPDVLVYWTDRLGRAGEVPSTAVLLGTLAGTDLFRADLPGEARERDGSLLLFSRGHRQLVGTIALSTASAVAAKVARP